MLLIEGRGTPQLRRWYVYGPWRVSEGRAREHWFEQLAQTTERIFEKLVDSLAGRPVMLPLSAGLDSRLVVSGLHRLGYRDVHVYSYGQAGNHEAAVARAVADRLGYRWTFIPFTQASVRACEASADWRRYVELADSCASVPFKQDFQAIQVLRQQGAVPSDAVFINGNSGDFISGNHVPAALHAPEGETPSETRKKRILDALLAKHFSLWRDLRTPANDERIRQKIRAAWARDGVPDTPASGDYGIYEHTEFQERQAKFVISGQRVYEFFGHGWRLPLWDNDYLDLWEQVPLELKIRQNLYKRFLLERNWAGVWRDIPVSPPRTIVPCWAAAARFFTKALCLPLGKYTWRSIDRRVFAYWTETLANYATTPYWAVLRDGRGHRSAMSWRCIAYLASHRRGPMGEPLDV
jgi:asparagine synthase (glutamine-hydrolysing)